MKDAVSAAHPVQQGRWRVATRENEEEEGVRGPDGGVQAVVGWDDSGEMLARHVKG